MQVWGEASRDTIRIILKIDGAPYNFRPASAHRFAGASNNASFYIANHPRMVVLAAGSVDAIDPGLLGRKNATKFATSVMAVIWHERNDIGAFESTCSYSDFALVYSF